MQNIAKAKKFSQPTKKIPFRDHPIVAGLCVMASGVFTFSWFAAAAAIGILISSQSGWTAAMFFVVFVICLFFGFKFVWVIGKKAVETRCEN